MENRKLIGDRRAKELGWKLGIEIPMEQYCFDIAFEKEADREDFFKRFVEAARRCPPPCPCYLERIRYDARDSPGVALFFPGAYNHLIDDWICSLRDGEGEGLIPTSGTWHSGWGPSAAILFWTRTEGDAVQFWPSEKEASER